MDFEKKNNKKLTERLDDWLEEQEELHPILFKIVFGIVMGLIICFAMWVGWQVIKLFFRLSLTMMLITVVSGFCIWVQFED